MGHGVRVYSSRTGKEGFASLYAKFSNFSTDVEDSGWGVTKRVAMDIKRDTRANINQRMERQSGVLENSVYYKKRPRKSPTYEVGVAAEYAEHAEFGTGIYNMFGTGRNTSWVYRSETTGDFVTTLGQEPNFFFNDAVIKNLSRFPKMLIVDIGRKLK